MCSRRPFIWLPIPLAVGVGLSLWAAAATAATVVAIDSGDTLRVREGGVVRTIRLACLDAPDLAQNPHGAMARAALRQLLPEGSVVTLVPPPVPEATTAVAEVFTPAGNVNVEMVCAGQAFTTLDRPSSCDPLRYTEAENTAQFRRLGVWQVAGGIQRPWDWELARTEAREQSRREEWLRDNGMTQPPGTGPEPSKRPSQPRARTGPEQLQPPSPLAYGQCLAAVRQRYQERSPGVPPPKGLFESFCGCLTKPRVNENPFDLARRCIQNMMQRAQSLSR